MSALFALDLSPLQIIFDECHKAKNATSTKMGKAVLDLQNKLPRARVVYASATGRLKHIHTHTYTKKHTLTRNTIH